MSRQIQRFSSVLLCAFLVACGGGGSGSDSTETSISATSLTTSNSDSISSEDLDVISVYGKAVKGPLKDVIVSMYRIDSSAPSYRGELVAEGFTTEDTELVLDVARDELGDLLYLLEYSDGRELDGSIPVIENLRTVISSDQLTANISIYATPLTTFAVEYAIAMLQKSAAGSVSQMNFVDAIETAKEQVVEVFGLGLLSGTVDLFTTVPILSNDTDQEASLAYRTAMEVFAAVVGLIVRESTDNGKVVTANQVVFALANDMLDGVLDGQDLGENIDLLAAVEKTRLQDIIRADPLSLKIPGTDNSIAQLVDIMSAEIAQIDTGVIPIGLSSPTTNPISLFYDAPDDGFKAVAITLSWTIPSQRENGDSLQITEIFGYRIYYYIEGESSSNGEVVAVAGGTTNEKSIVLSKAGTYIFAISSVDSENLESEFSDVAKIVIN